MFVSFLFMHRLHSLFTSVSSFGLSDFRSFGLFLSFGLSVFRDFSDSSKILLILPYAKNFAKRAAHARFAHT